MPHSSVRRATSSSNVLHETIVVNQPDIDTSTDTGGSGDVTGDDLDNVGAFDVPAGYKALIEEIDWRIHVVPEDNAANNTETGTVYAEISLEEAIDDLEMADFQGSDQTVLDLERDEALDADMGIWVWPEVDDTNGNASPMQAFFGGGNWQPDGGHYTLHYPGEVHMNAVLAGRGTFSNISEVFMTFTMDVHYRLQEQTD